MQTERPGHRKVENVARPKATYSPPDREQSRTNAETEQKSFIEELKIRLGTKKARFVHDAIVDANNCAPFNLPSPTERPVEANETGLQIQALKRRSKSARQADMQEMTAKFAKEAKRRGLI